VQVGKRDKVPIENHVATQSFEKKVKIKVKPRAAKRAKVGQEFRRWIRGSRRTLPRKKKKNKRVNLLYAKFCQIKKKNIRKGPRWGGDFQGTGTPVAWKKVTKNKRIMTMTKGRLADYL